MCFQFQRRRAAPCGATAGSRFLVTRGVTGVKRPALACGCSMILSPSVIRVKHSFRRGKPKKPVGPRVSERRAAWSGPAKSARVAHRTPIQPAARRARHVRLRQREERRPDRSERVAEGPLACGPAGDRHSPAKILRDPTHVHQHRVESRREPEVVGRVPGDEGTHGTYPADAPAIRTNRTIVPLPLHAALPLGSYCLRCRAKESPVTDVPPCVRV